MKYTKAPHNILYCRPFAKISSCLTKTFGCCLLVILFLLLIPAPQTGVLFSQDTDSRKQVEQTISDGPYIYRKGNHVLFRYSHNSKPISKNFWFKESQSTITISAFNHRYVIPSAPPECEPYRFRKVKKIFVISDIHGQFQWFKELLIKHKIVNKKMQWRWGKGHLVILGDVFDRGEHVTETLWAVHQLEMQARRKGGRVHLLLGNHEVMILQGDLRYVHPKYSIVAETLNTPITVLYGPDYVLGQWLRTKNTVIKINDLLFVHGGIHPEIFARNLDMKSINRTVRQHLDSPAEIILSDETLHFLFKGNGPFWYRGYFPDMNGYERLEEDLINQTLDRFKAKHIIVGHTTQERITSLYKRKVIGVDSGIKYGDKGEALLWKKGKFYRATLGDKLIPLKKQRSTN